MSQATPDYPRGTVSTAQLLANWVGMNSTVSAQQISEWSGGLKAEIGENLSARNQGLFSNSELARCERNPRARLEKVAVYFRDPPLVQCAANAPDLDARFHKASLGQIYYLTNTRNAWHSTTIHQYSPRAFSIFRQTANERAEKQRTQGSSFHISEWPSLVLQSDEITLIGLEINADQQFARFSEVFDGEPVLSRVVRAYQSAPRNSVIWLRAEGNYKLPEPAFSGDQTGRRWRSVSQGSNYWLGWSETSGTRVAAGLADAQKRAAKSIRRSASGN